MIIEQLSSLLDDTAALETWTLTDAELRLPDRYQRHSIIKRDGGCCWKGNGGPPAQERIAAGEDRPPAWCEVHHPEPYGEGGPTTVDNGALFCFIHHRRPLRHDRFTELRPRAA